MTIHQINIAQSLALIAICLCAIIGCQHQTSAPHVIKQSVPSPDGNPTTFEMVLVPGDKDSGIKPFYISKTEVTWGMFLYWANAEDLVGKTQTMTEEWSIAVQKGLRPSLLTYVYISRDLDLPKSRQSPAIGMSWRTAQAYCVWLSEQTGRHYRLPTDQEWLHALRLGGGVPVGHKALFDHAVLNENAPIHEKILKSIPTKVASKQPNKLGIYDMLGNAAEWIEPTKKKRWLRGGHFRLPAEELTEDWRVEEDLDIWMESWPSLPPSRFWYLDHYYQGIRLVCEVEPSVE